MCFTITTKKCIRPIPKEARKNITVFKIIGTTGYGLHFLLHINGNWETWQKGYEYIETTPFKGMWRQANKWKIEGHAFHSKILKTDAIEIVQSMVLPEAWKVVRMIIPKGALYFKNDIDYVSDRLVYPL